MNTALQLPLNEKRLELQFPIITFEHVPLLSVFRDQYNQLYLCLCSEMRGMMRWILSYTTLQILDDLISFRITINDALSTPLNQLYVLEFSHGEYSCQIYQKENIDPYFLAEEGTYAEYQNDNVEQLFAAYKQSFSPNEVCSYFIDTVKTEEYVHSFDRHLLQSSCEEIVYPAAITTTTSINTLADSHYKQLLDGDKKQIVDTSKLNDPIWGMAA